MNCLPCFQNNDDTNGEDEDNNDMPIAQPKDFPPSAHNGHGDRGPLDDSRNEGESEDTTVKSFTFRELATATKNFRGETLLGEGGFGKIFKGTLAQSGQIVAVRQLDRNGMGKDFVFEVSTLSLLQHPNVVRMVGYCADGEQRLLVYEYLPSGSLESHLFDLPDGKSPLDWTSRMKIALGIAEGLEFLHEKADPPLIYRDLKSSSVLLTEANKPKLSDCGVFKLVQSGQKMHVSVMAGYNGYCAPEYERNGDLTLKADVYSFGVVLLELITGRRALDTSRPADEQSLVSWAQPLFKDPSKYPDMADPLLRKGFSVTSLNQAVGVAAMCLQEEPMARPFISDISAALSFLAMAPPEAPIPERLAPMLSRVATARQGGDDHKQDDSSESEEDESDQDMDYNRKDDGSSSEYEYGDSTEGSDDDEETKRVMSQKEPNPDKARCKSTKSKKLASSSKRKSKKSVKITSPRNSRDSSNFREGRGRSKSRKDKKQQSHGSDHSSSSDKENWNNGGSSPRNRSEDEK